MIKRDIYIYVFVITYLIPQEKVLLSIIADL